MATRSGRHRAAVRPVTPMSAVLNGTSARRSLAVMASSGLVLTIAGAPAAAGPAGESAALPNVDLSAATAKALSALVIGPRVSVPAETTWSVDEVVADVDVSAPVVRRTESAPSRTGARAALQATPVEAPAEPAAAAAPEAPPSASAAQIIALARQFVGTPYVFGGATPGGFDCSGFTSYVFAQVGISLPRSSSAQRYAGTVVSAADARPGDLVWGPGHVGIYTGNGQHIAARNPGLDLFEGPIFVSDPVFIRVLG